MENCATSSINGNQRQTAQDLGIHLSVLRRWKKELEADGQSVSEIVKPLKGRTSRSIQDAYPELKKSYWGRHLWAISYGAWSTGNITGQIVEAYLEHHRDPSNNDTGNMILE